MGNILTSKLESACVNFDYIRKNLGTAVIINTLPITLQECLIEATIDAGLETETINHLIDENKKDVCLILYGKNHTDITVHQKYRQLVQFGFVNVKIYLGGMFEWLLLQDVYGEDEFPTKGDNIQTDILFFK